VAKKSSRNPEEYGRGSEEGLAAAGAANNAAVSGAYIPALVFGIPGDAITAIVIGVLFMKGVNPGPTIFLKNPSTVYGILMAFRVAIFMPIILVVCMVGSVAVDNTVTAVGVTLAFGVIGYFMDETGIPIPPFVLGIVLALWSNRTS